MINTDSVLHGFTDLKNLDDLGPIVLNQAKEFMFMIKMEKNI
jgi:hypothetical protein